MEIKISVDKIYPHPDNPRKSLGDLDEMVKSVEKNGIMQNLTIIPKEALTKEPEEQPAKKDINTLSEFYVLIGHRRLAAAKKAGLTEVPCNIITNISKREQLGIMLEENMQRSDLTIYEQAQGFQMMLDLGESVEDIVEKTGFSKATVYHRLNIAKLNQKELQKKESDENFQLSIKNLLELEKIKSVKTRDKVLKEARDSSNLVYLAKQAVREEKREENEKIILKKLKDRNMKPLPKGEHWYSHKWEVVKEFDLDKDLPEKITVKKTEEELYWNRSYQNFRIMTKASKKTTEKQGLSEKEKETRRNRKLLKSTQDNLAKNIELFMSDILNKKIEWIDQNKFLDLIWKYLIMSDERLYHPDLYMTMSDQYEYWWEIEEKVKEELIEKFEKLPIAYQMLTAASLKKIPDVYSYDLYLQKERARTVQQLVKVLELFGFSINDEEQQLLDGSHEAYEKQGR